VGLDDGERGLNGFTRRLARSLTNNRPFIVVWLAIFVTIAGVGMVSPLLPVFAKDMGASGVWIGLAFSGFAISQIPLMLVVGRLSDRFGKKRFLWLGLLIYTLVAAGYIWAPGFRELLLFRVLSGVGTALVIPVAYAYIGELAPLGREGRYMGLLNAATIAGFGTGPMLGGFVNDRFGMDPTFLSMGVLSATSLVAVLLFLPAKPSVRKAISTERHAGSFAPILKDDTMRGIVVFHFLLGLSYGAVLAFLPVFMTDVRYASGMQVGMVIGARYVLNGTLSYPFGWLADRANRVLLATSGIVLVAAGIFFIPWVGGFAALLLLLMAIGVCEGLAVPSANAIGVDRGRAFGMGSVMGLINMSLASAMLFSSVVGGTIESSIGIGWVFRCVALACLVLAAAFLFLVRRGMRSTKDRELHHQTQWTS
jgi:DHA1 family multidrug resistance protein-like MFS transporter